MSGASCLVYWWVVGVWYLYTYYGRNKHKYENDSKKTCTLGDLHRSNVYLARRSIFADVECM
jgi:hypothetical protein